MNSVYDYYDPVSDSWQMPASDCTVEGAAAHKVYRVFDGENAELSGGYVTDFEPVSRQDAIETLCLDAWEKDDGSIIQNEALYLVEGTVYTQDNYILDKDNGLTDQELLWDPIMPTEEHWGGANEFVLDDFENTVWVDKISMLPDENDPDIDEKKLELEE